MKPLGPADPAKIGPYRLIAELGSGGMGRVFLGSAPDGRPVAVKRVHPWLVEEEGFRARFDREVTASRSVAGAYTAAVFDADPNAPIPWLASVFVPGPSLHDAVTATGPLPPESVRRLAAGLAAALLEIHRAGLVHRDLKPANVLLTDDGVRVIDFGIAKAAEQATGTDVTRTGWLIGSPPFMSPEQAEGRQLGPASDMFSLGCVLAQAATGTSPFAGPSAPQVLYHVVHTAPDLSALPDELRNVIEPCLAKDPDQRPDPAKLLELIGEVPATTRPWPGAVHRLVTAQHAELGRLLDGGSLTLAGTLLQPQPPPLPPQPQKAPRRRKPIRPGVWFWPLRVLLVLVGAVVGWFVTLDADVGQPYYVSVEHQAQVQGVARVVFLSATYCGTFVGIIVGSLLGLVALGICGLRIARVVAIAVGVCTVAGFLLGFLAEHDALAVRVVTLHGRSITGMVIGGMLGLVPAFLGGVLVDAGPRMKGVTTALLVATLGTWAAGGACGYFRLLGIELGEHGLRLDLIPALGIVIGGCVAVRLTDRRRRPAGAR